MEDDHLSDEKIEDLLSSLSLKCEEEIKESSELDER